MMSWVNYHSHTHYCDGKAPAEEFIKSAIDKGFVAYGFSSHAPVPFQSTWNMHRDHLQEYLGDVSEMKRKYGSKIQVYAGLEIDYIDGYWGKSNTFLREEALDYFVGSVHYVDRFEDGSFFCFDGGKPAEFFKSLELLYKGDYRQAVKKYFHAVRQMVEKDSPDIIGHMDKIKMHNAAGKYFDEEEGWYVQEVEDTLDAIAAKNCIVEVNTRGIYRRDPPVLYPAKWVIKRIHHKGIPVMINSDAHHPSDLDKGLNEAVSVLLETGFESMRILLDGKWMDVEFNEKGIMLPGI